MSLKALTNSHDDYNKTQTAPQFVSAHSRQCSTSRSSTVQLKHLWRPSQQVDHAPQGVGGPCPAQADFQSLESASQSGRNED